MARNIALLSSEVKILTIFFVQILLTCDPKVSNASARERVRGTLQKSLYRRGRKGARAKGWSVRVRLCMGDYLRSFQLLTKTYSLLILRESD